MAPPKIDYAGSGNSTLLRRFTTLTLVLAPLRAFSHGGGLDKNGGHNQNGTYHCHTMACTGSLVKADPVEEAKAEGRASR